MKAEEYLESKAVGNQRFVMVVTLEQAKIALEIGKLESKIEQWEKSQELEFNASRAVKISSCRFQIENYLKS